MPDPILEAVKVAAKENGIKCKDDTAAKEILLESVKASYEAKMAVIHDRDPKSKFPKIIELKDLHYDPNNPTKIYYTHQGNIDANESKITNGFLQGQILGGITSDSPETAVKNLVRNRHPSSENKVGMLPEDLIPKNLEGKSLEQRFAALNEALGDSLNTLQNKGVFSEQKLQQNQNQQKHLS